MTVAIVGLALMGFNTIRVGDIPVSDFVFFLLAGILWLLMLTDRVGRLSSPSERRSSARLLAAIIVLLAFATVSSFRSWYPVASVTVVLRLGYLTVLWFWILRCLSIDRRAIALLIRGWRVGVLIACTAAIAANAGLVTIGRVNPENRQTGWFYHPNDLAGFIAVAIPVFLMAAPRGEMMSRKMANGRWLATVGFAVFALSTTGSMSALLAAAVGTSAAGVAYLLTRRPGSWRVHPLKVMAVGAVGLVGVVVLFNSDVPVVERITRYEEGDSNIAGSVGTRGDLNERVILEFDDLLVLGHGLDAEAQDDLRGSGKGIHNMYVKMLYEGGLIASVALVAALIIMLQQGWKLLRNMNGTAVYIDLLAVFGSAVTGITFAMFQPTTTQRYFWMPFALIQCYWTVRKAELRRRKASTDPAPGPGPRAVGAPGSA